MLKLRDGIVELFIKTATSLPPDVSDAIKKAHSLEKKGTQAKLALGNILEKIRTAREIPRPICEDTGVPVFYVSVPIGLTHIEVEKTIIEATRIATRKIPMRPNAVDIITGKNSGDNTGEGFPIIYFKETSGSTLTIDLMLKGGGCENIGQLYKLPIANQKAGKIFNEVGECVMDSIKMAKGKGCPPYVIGVGIGASKDQVTRLAKAQLMRKLPSLNEKPALAKLEKKLLKEVNALGIGPLGLGGKTTALGVKIGVNHRHSTSCFVDISVACWAHRRGRLMW